MAGNKGPLIEIVHEFLKETLFKDDPPPEPINVVIMLAPVDFPAMLRTTLARLERADD